MSRTNARRIGIAALVLGVIVIPTTLGTAAAQAAPAAGESATQAVWRDNRILRPGDGEVVSGEVLFSASGARYGTRAFFVERVEIGRTDEWTDIDITHEYTRAALDFRLGYLDLKRMARTSLEHSFLPGASLWAQPDQFTVVNAACAQQPLGSENPASRCATFLQANEKAAEQWQLEHRYKVFESTIQ